MQYYKGLYSASLYNLGFLGGWRCGDVTIDGHYSFVTDLKEFVVWKFGTYGNLISITDDYQEPILTEIEIHMVNDAILSQIRRDMSNSISPNLTDIADPIWDTIYGDVRIEMHEQWGKLKHYPFSKSNVSLNVTRGDTVKDVETGEEILISYIHDIKSVNQYEKWVLVPEKRYSYFPDLSQMRTKTEI